MKLTPKQRKIYQFAKANGGITKAQAMGLIDDHYCNGDKHVGAVLSRMVKAGILERVKPGVFNLRGMADNSGITDNSKLF